MRLFGKNLDEDVAVIAELGVNHGGSLVWITEMLAKLKESGVTAVKFQLFTPDLYASRSNTKRHEFLKSVFLAKGDFLHILTTASRLNLPVFATPLTHDWVQFVAENCGVIKIASGDFNFNPTVQAALESDSTVIASTGAASVDEINHFVNKAMSVRPRVEETVALLHCIAAYPPPLSQANLQAIPFLKESTNLEIGFSSHFLEDAPIYASLALGARIFEIHVTDDRERSDIRDHALSRTPQELTKIVENLNNLCVSMRQPIKSIQPVELEVVNAIRKGVIYCRDLSVGHILTREDLDFARPFNAQVPSIELVLGKRLRRNVSAYHSVSLEDYSEVI